MIGNGDVVMNFIKLFSLLHQYLQIQTVLARPVGDHHSWVCSMSLFSVCSQVSLKFIKAWRSIWNFHEDVLILMSLSSSCFITAFLFNFSLLLLLAYCTPSVPTFFSYGSILFSFTRDSSIPVLYLHMFSYNHSFYFNKLCICSD